MNVLYNSDKFQLGMRGNCRLRAFVMMSVHVVISSRPAIKKPSKAKQASKPAVLATAKELSGWLIP